MRSFAPSLVLLVCTTCGGSVASSAPPDAGAGVPDSTAPVDAAADTSPDAPRVACVRARRSIATDAPVAIATDLDTLYWVDDANGNGAVRSTPKCAPGAVSAPVMLPEAASGIAVDAHRVYVSAFSTVTARPAGGVYAIDVPTSAISKIADAPQGASGVAAAGGWVYWTERATDHVGRVRPDGTGAETVAVMMKAPTRVAVLADGTVCVLGASLACLPPGGAQNSDVVAGLDDQHFASDDRAVYVAARAPAGALSVYQLIPPGGFSRLGFVEGDAGAGLPFSGLGAPGGGVYVFYGTGTLQWVPADGSPPIEETLASSLPPFVFFADADGVYFDANTNGLEIAPPLFP